MLRRSKATNLGVKMLNADGFFKTKKIRKEAAALYGVGAALQEKLLGSRPLPLRSSARLEVAGGWHV